MMMTPPLPSPPIRVPVGAGQRPRSLSLRLYPTGMSDERTLFTTTEAARQLGISPSTVKDAIATGTLEHVPIHARLNMVTLAAIEAYRRDHLGQQGRPKGTKGKPPPPADSLPAGGNQADQANQAAHHTIIEEGHTRTQAPREGE